MKYGMKVLNNGASVSFDRNSVSGFFTVLLRNPSGQVHDKITFDTYRGALEYRRAFISIGKNL